MLIPKNKIFKSLLAALFLILVIINSKTILNPFRRSLVDLSSAPLKVLHNILNLSKKIVPFASLREENKLLRRQLELLTTKMEELKATSDENTRLKSLLDFKLTLPYSTTPAQVIGRDPTNWSNSIIINKGSRDGIKPNKAVLSTKGVVGRVMEVGRYSSKVLLISDPNSKVGVIIQRNRQGGILVGSPGGKCKVIYIALDSDVSFGDKVLTAGFGSIFPKDMIVGQVIKVYKEPGRLYKNALVIPQEDLSRLEEVLCVR